GSYGSASRTPTPGYRQQTDRNGKPQTPGRGLPIHHRTGARKLLSPVWLPARQHSRNQVRMGSSQRGVYAVGSRRRENAGCFRVGQVSARILGSARRTSFDMTYPEDFDELVVSSKASFTLLDPQTRVAYCLHQLEAEVNNGGIHQFFSNSSGEYVRE